MAVRFQIVIDCRDPEPLARFWASALGYDFEPPPEGFATWDDYWRDVGVGEDDLGIGQDCIIDPGGSGPRIWFQVVPEPKAVKNRCTWISPSAAAVRSRSKRGAGESTPRPSA